MKREKGKQKENQEKKSKTKKMPDALKRKERQECWKARDEYYGCMETNLVPYLLINQEKKVLEAQGTFLFTF